MRHPNKQNGGPPVLGTKARKKAARTAAFRAGRGMSRTAYQLWKRAKRFAETTGGQFPGMP